MRRALEKSSGVATRLLIGQGDAPYLDVAVAVAPGEPALGALFLRADAREAIASVVETWTEPSESARADLRRASWGDDVGLSGAQSGISGEPSGAGIHGRPEAYRGEGHPGLYGAGFRAR